MIGENISYYKSKLKHAEKSGPQLVTVENIRVFRDENRNSIMQNGKIGFVVKFKNENIEHEELYWSMSSKLVRFKDVFDKIRELSKMWIVIRHNITMNGDVEVKREAEIVHCSADEKMPNYPQIFEEYDIVSHD